MVSAAGTGQVSRQLNMRDLAEEAAMDAAVKWG
jgi:hypothetical protein